jgi:hypothetical protein
MKARMLRLFSGAGKDRYSMTAEGAIQDRKTGLEWAVGPDKGFDYEEAVAWVLGCSIDGGGWRMPTVAQLNCLYVKGGHRNMEPPFKTMGSWVWAEPEAYLSAWVFDFVGGKAHPAAYVNFDRRNFRCFGVRPQSQKSGTPVAPEESSARFSVSHERVVRDLHTGLEWVTGADRHVNYREAAAWVRGCRIDGGGWRMPTRAELKSLYVRGLGRRNRHIAFKTSVWWVWAEPRGSEYAWIFPFIDGDENCASRHDHVGDTIGVFGVRSCRRPEARRSG